LPDRVLSAAARRAAVGVLASLLIAGSAGAAASTPAATTSAVTSPAVSTTAATAPAVSTPTTSTTTTSTTTTSTTAAKPAKTKAAKPAKTKAAKPAKPKPAPKPITGYLSGVTPFPDRALVISTPPGISIGASRVHVSENGRPVGGLTVTPMTQANVGDFGLVLVIDQSPSMSGQPLAQAMASAQAIAARRSGQQRLGIISFDSAPSVLLALTSSQRTINQVVATTPWTGPGSNVSAALALALKHLAQAKVVAGAVIVISDGVGTQGAGAPAQAVTTAAQAAHVPIFTVGLRDSASTAGSLQGLARIAGGTFMPATGSNLVPSLATLVAKLTRGYVVRYRSLEHAGQQVAVSASVDGVPGTVTASYTAPVAPVVLPQRHRAPAPPAQPSFAHAGLLNSLPSFAPGSVTPVAQRRSFWSSPTSVLVVSAASALLLALAILMLLLRRPTKGAVQTRVGSFIPGPLLLEDGTLVQAPPSGNPFVRLVEGGRWWPPFVENVAVARSRHTPLALVKRAAAMGAVATIFFTLVLGSPLLGLLALLAWPFVLRSLMGRAARKQRERFRDLLPAHLQDLAGAMRAGRSVVGGIASVAESADEPIRSEFERAVTDEQLGRPLEESLQAVAERMQADDMDQVALIAALNRRSGSNVAESIERVADGARERADLRRELKALTGQAKMSSMVLTGLPPLMLIGLSVMAPQYAHPMFHTTVGIILLGIGATMVFAGWRVMMKIINVDP
jgi:Flp pilus assembly protein TadB